MDPMILGALGLGLVLMLAGGFALVRRRRAGVEQPEGAAFEEGDSMIEHYADDDISGDATEVPAGPAPDEVAEEEDLLAGSDDITERPGAPEPAAAEAPAEAEDPLSELNVYMAYEHFDQAEELVRNAIAGYPDRHDYRLKLLEVFYAAKDMPSFQAAARELQDLVGEDSPLMGTASGWWSDLAPGRDLFAGPEAVAAEDVSSGDDMFDVTSSGGEESDTDSGVDFDLGFEMTGAAEDAGAEGEGSSVDFEIGGADEEADTAASAADSDLDFDIGAGDAAPAEAELDEDSVLDFELDGTADVGKAKRELEAKAQLKEKERLEAEAAEESGVADSAAAGALDFDISGDFGTSGEAAAPDSGLDLDLGADADSGAAEAAESEDLGIDFDLGGGESETDAAAVGSEDFHESPTLTPDDVAEVSAGEAEASESGLDFDIGTGSGDSESEDLGLDFDIGGGDEAAASGDEELAIGFEQDESDADLDLSLDMGTDEAAIDDTQTTSGIDTVHLGTQKAAEVMASEPVGGESVVDFDLGGGDEGEGTPEEEIGIDTVFKPVFDAQPSEGEEASVDLDIGSDSGLDLDIGAGESLGLDVGSGEAPESAGGDDVPSLDLGADDGSVDFEIGGDVFSTDDSGESSSFDLSLDENGETSASVDELADTQYLLRDVPAPAVPEAEDDDEDEDEDKTLVLGRKSEEDGVQTKLDLAEAYIEMGDAEGARGILGEVMSEGSEAQQEHAKALLEKLG
jgi:pilus assembly protein FimV